MRFLNFNKVLCLSPHPDDVEISMMGSIIKYPNTHFDILCLTRGGAKGFDKTNKLDRRGEVKNVWAETNCKNVSLYNSKFEYFEDTNEPGWINFIENEFIKNEADGIMALLNFYIQEFYFNLKLMGNCWMNLKMLPIILMIFL